MIIEAPTVLGGSCGLEIQASQEAKWTGQRVQILLAGREQAILERY